jgi:hypothetical protein
LDAERLIFLEETGVDTSTTPTRGWAPKRRPTTTVVLAMGLDDLGGSLAFPDAMDEQAFRAATRSRRWGRSSGTACVASPPGRPRTCVRPSPTPSITSRPEIFTDGFGSQGCMPCRGKPL